jgi:lantibiotic modifying enzyme
MKKIANILAPASIGIPTAGHSKEDICQQFEMILRYYQQVGHDQCLPSYGLYSGKAGIVLLHALLLQATADEKYYYLIKEGLDHIIENIEHSPLQPFFSNGLAGVGWLLLYLNEKNILDINSDLFLEKIDASLETSLDLLLQQRNFDPIMGATGIALYFLKRNNAVVLERMIRTLENFCIRLNDEIIWTHQSAYEDNRLIPFGLGQGNAGIVFFLSKCCNKGILTPVCLQLVRGGFQFFEANLQNLDVSRSIFPSHKYEKGYLGSKDHQYARLGWLYGDIGILFSLYRSATLLNDDARAAQYLGRLVESTRRKNRSVTGVDDAGLCFGSSGIGYIYLKLYKTTGIPVFKDSFKFWMAETLTFGRNGNGPAGFLFQGSAATHPDQSALLTGLGGVALFYASYVYNELSFNNWDECLLLS